MVKRFIAILLAFLYLGTNLGFSFGIHYCGGRIAEAKILILDHELGCGMETDVSSCDKPVGESISKKSCCQDQVESLLLEEEAKLSSKKWDVKTAPLIISERTDKIDSNVIEESITSNYFLNRLRPNLQVLFQSFLI